MIMFVLLQKYKKKQVYVCENICKNIGWLGNIWKSGFMVVNIFVNMLVLLGNTRKSGFTFVNIFVNIFVLLGNIWKSGFIFPAA